MTTIDIADLGPWLESYAETIGTSYDDAARKVVAEKAEEVRVLASRYAPRRTGRLANSITVRYADDGYTAEVYSDVPYAPFMEFGTGTRGEFPGTAYVIRPVKGTYLKFTVNGKTIFTKKVVHPGVAPRPFLRPAFDRSLADLAVRINDDAVSELQSRRW